MIWAIAKLLKDIVPIFFAYLTKQKFMAFIVSTSSYYEGEIKLPFLTKLMLKSPRCLKIFTRDQFTADDMQKKGFSQAIFAGYPIMDVLKPNGNNLHLVTDLAMIALLTGSRLPEALHNLELELQVCEQLILLGKIDLQFRVALVPSIQNNDLKIVAKNQQWEYLGKGKLIKNINNKSVEVLAYNDAFADIISQCNLVLGMAGTAVEQSVGLGKPVVQIPGKGPQFTYRFAEAQMRLLGLGVRTIKEHNSKEVICQKAAFEIINILQDKIYQQKCQKNGKIRVGEKGGSRQIASLILNPDLVPTKRVE
jgi:uncharacterized protein (TIGR03492 family)